MGLALPLNSDIAHQLPAATNDIPDGASLASNLFSMTPLSAAPGARFLSLALERPGSDRVPSVLGIGRHPSKLVSDPNKIEYASVVSSNVGATFWQARVTAITVYVDDKPLPISLPHSVVPGASAPSAILDSGVPLIVTTTQIADAIYGALGVGPANDGNYYLPCTTALNVSVQLDSRSELFLHPLDLTTYPLNGGPSDNCIGLIQTPASIPGANFGTLADIILGVPFLRNTYFVMAYDPPLPNGTFPANSANSNSVDDVRPRLGLMNLTDPVVAADEFYQVRVLKQPLGNAVPPTASHGKGLSVGVKVLFALLGFVVLCIVLFAARWAYMRRKYRREGANADAFDGNSKSTAYALNALGSRKTRSGEPTEDELRLQRFEEYKRRQMGSQYTDDSSSTTVADAAYGKRGADEFGLLKLADAPGTPLKDYFDPYDDTLVASPAPDHLQKQSPTIDHLSPLPRTARRSDLSPRSMHHRTPSGGPSSDMPLLAHAHVDSSAQFRDSTFTEFGMESISGTPNSMVGIGRRRLSSMAGSPMSPESRDEYFPRVAPYHSHGRSGSAASVTMRGSPPRSPVAIPAPVFAVEPAAASERVMDPSQNVSRMSVTGHETET
ncbi:hypothetical protein DICSQDRAFT_174971 [Dichomitus squalens LYAD-421 SS1]|uniref:Peptidase A1 domain-containing protein n=1 Tax=Dichomitus squalens (strain LYAD-421) TaxID=732165 RepID=R7SMW2_DICSQ|nr:uncharacterized protein DICSQDRAFT_174971 [Dichomitus squalens LYAD-421 SS1]EJF56337.1 hypothetical protein DICSQDRAFT_174971 [Dichomitus squalens LYAD-421 SS1]